MPSLRLLTYNVRSMRDDRAALARVIRAAEADVVCVQESPRFARWRSLCAQLARTSNLVVVGGGRPAGSNLIMSTLGVDVVNTADVLFRPSGRHRRGTAIAVLSYRGSRFAVAGIHLDLAEPARVAQAGESEAALAAHVPSGVPVVVAGDVNDQPGSAVWRALTARRRDAAAELSPRPGTYPSTGAQRTIDGVFTDPSIGVVSASVLSHPDAAAASDHLPVLVELDLP